MKKIISLLLAAMMLVGIFAGCGGTGKLQRGGKLGSGLHPGDSYGGTPAAGRGVESGCSLRRRKQHP